MPHYRRPDDPPGAVTGVHNHPDGPLKGDVLRAVLDVGAYDVCRGAAAPARREGAFLHDATKLLNFGARDGRLAYAYFEPIVFRRVMASSNHHPAVEIEVIKGEV